MKINRSLVSKDSNNTKLKKMKENVKRSELTIYRNGIEFTWKRKKKPKEKKQEKERKNKRTKRKRRKEERGQRNGNGRDRNGDVTEKGTKEVSHQI